MSTRLARASWVVPVLLAVATIVLLVLSGDDTQGKTLAFDVVLAVVLLLYPTGPQNDVAFRLLLIGAFAAIPMVAGVAILRDRLYDIDVVINRAVVRDTVQPALVSVWLR
jgi:hypothetical protein